MGQTMKIWLYDIALPTFGVEKCQGVRIRGEFGDSLPSRGWHIRRPASTKETDATKSTLGIFFGHPTEWDRRGRVEKKMWPERWDPRFPEMLLETSLAEYHLDHGGPIWVIPNWIKKLENEMMGLILPILEICGFPWNSTHLGAPDFFEHPMNMMSMMSIMSTYFEGLMFNPWFDGNKDSKSQGPGLRWFEAPSNVHPIFKTRNTWQQLKSSMKPFIDGISTHQDTATFRGIEWYSNIWSNRC